MELSRFQDTIFIKFEPINRDFSYALSSGYADLIFTYDLFLEISDRTRLLYIRDHTNLLVTEYRYQSLLLKSLFIYAGICLDAFSKIIINNPNGSFHNLVSNRADYRNYITENEIFIPYLINIYRNKIIVHNDIVRNQRGGRDLMNPEQFRMSPFNNAETNLNDTEKTFIRTEIGPNEMSQIANLNEAIDLLFYRIPLDTLQINASNRLMINSIAEKVGCISLYPIEIINSLDTLFLNSSNRII